MAVAAADFYTYARATGTPLPKSKQEEAELTPVVNRWKRERLNDTRREESGNNVAALGALAGVGALALAGLNRRPLQRRVQAPSDAITTGVGGLQKDLNKKVTTGADTTVTWDDTRKSWEPTREVVDPDLESLADEQIDIIRGTVANPKLYPETTSEVRRQIARARKIEQQSDLVLKELREEGLQETKGSKALSSNDFLQQEGPGKYIDPEDVVTSPAGNVPKSETVPDQTINAIDAAEDQQTGRVVRSLQRNEDLDQGKIALLEDITEDNNQRMINNASPEQMAGYEADAAINKVASELPDGLPVDQAEGFKPSLGPGMQWYKNQSGEIVGASAGGPASVPVVKGISPVGGLKQISTEPTAAQSFLQSERDEIASQLAEQNLPVTSGRIETELANRYGPKAYTYGPDYTKRKHALQLGATYDTKFFDDVDLPSVQLAGETIPVKPERRYTEATTPYTGTKYLDDYSDSLKTPFYSEDTALQLQENVAEKKAWLAGVRADAETNINQIYTERRNLVEKQGKLISQQLEVAKAKGQQGAVNELSKQLENLRKVWRNPSLGLHREGEVKLAKARIRGAEKSINQGIKEATVPLTVAEKAENPGRRVYTEMQTGVKGQKVGKQLPDVDLSDEVVDSIDTIQTPEIDPQSIQFRPERYTVDLHEGKGKGGGGRKVADYSGGGITNESVREIQTGGTIRNVQGRVRQTRGRYRDYDPETGGAPQPPFQDDSLETGSKKDIYGTRLASLNRDSPENVPTDSLVSYRKPAGQRKDNTLNIAVTGGRKYQNYEELSQRLDEAINQLNPTEGTNINIIAGGATGADRLAERYARERNYGLTVKPANWTKQGKAAGPIRNREMAQLADVGVAFPGGTGTQNMIQTMGQEGKPILNTAEIQQPTAAMRGQSGTRAVNIAENIRHLSDPNWLASQGYDLNKVSPQQLVGEYLQRLQSKTGSSDLQQYLQRRGRKN